MLRPWLATGICALLAGCGSPPEVTVPIPVDGIADSENFDLAPQGWSMTDSTWNVQNGTMQGLGQVKPGLGALVDDEAGNFADFEALVSFRVRGGDHPNGAGVVFHWVDEENYQIIRYSLSELDWHLFTVNSGNRDKQRDATQNGTTRPEFGEWVTLRVISAGGLISAFDGDVKLIEYRLQPSDAAVGKVGLFVRGNSLAEFDDFEVAPL